MPLSLAHPGTTAVSYSGSIVDPLPHNRQVVEHIVQLVFLSWDFRFSALRTRRTLQQSAGVSHCPDKRAYADNGSFGGKAAILSLTIFVM